MPLPLEQRVREAAETALAERKCIDLIELFQRMGFLYAGHVDAWRKGRIPDLLQLMQCGADKFSHSVELFREWAASRGLEQTEVQWTTSSRAGQQPLHVSRDAATDAMFRLRYVPPGLQPKQLERLSKPPASKLVVFSVVKDTACSQCRAEIARDGLLLMEKGQPLCMDCAEMEHLVYLGAGDAALTRRATKYSRLSAVVVRFSRARKRHERHGVLVEEEALARAERECLDDAAGRAARRERTAAGRALDESALTAAVIASVRHRHTDYDERLSGAAREQARQATRDKVEEVLELWRGGGAA